MKRRAFLFAPMVLVACHAGAQQPKAPDPAAAVKAYYAAKPGKESAFYSERLKALYAAASKKSEELGEPVSGIDFSPAISGQDADADFQKTLKLAAEPRGAGAARVVATFRQFRTDRKVTTLHYSLVLEGNAWKIDEIENPAKGNEGWVFSKLLEAGAQGQ